MRQTAIAAFIFCLCFSLSSQAQAQNCKMGHTMTDAITKEKYDLWVEVLSAPGVMTPKPTITGLVWRQANVNYIGLRFQKFYRSEPSGQFETSVRGAVGKPFYFGFKNGEPIAFEVTEVFNGAGVSGGLFAPPTGVKTAEFRAAISDKALAALRESLVSRQIDAVRLALEGDVQIDASVDNDRGKGMMERFSCFYELLDKKGIDLSTAADPPANPAKSGSLGGKQAEQQKPAAQLTIDQVIQMVAAKLADDLIITTIQKSSSKFDLTPDALIKLKTAGVSDEVIRAMTK